MLDEVSVGTAQHVLRGLQLQLQDSIPVVQEEYKLRVTTSGVRNQAQIYVEMFDKDVVGKMGYRKKETRGYVGHSFQPFSSYTSFVFCVIKYFLGMSESSIDLLISLLSHPAFNKDDIPKSAKAVGRQIMQQLPLLNTTKHTSGGKTVGVEVDVHEVLQIVLANPYLAPLMRYYPVKVEEHGSEVHNTSRSGMWWRDRFPSRTMSVAAVDGSNVDIGLWNCVKITLSEQQIQCLNHDTLARYSADVASFYGRRHMIGLVTNIMYSGFCEEDKELSMDEAERPCDITVQLLYPEELESIIDGDISRILKMKLSKYCLTMRVPDAAVDIQQVHITCGAIGTWYCI